MIDIANDIHTKSWEFYGAAAKPLYITIYPPLYTFGSQKRYGIGVDIIYASEQNRANWFMRADRLTELAETMLPMLLEKQWGWYDQCVAELAQFQLFNQKFLATELSTLSNEEVTALMREYRALFIEPFITNNLIEPFSLYFQNNLRDMLVAEGIDEARASTLMDTYGQAARINYVRECAEAYRHAASDEERESVRQQYYYLFNDYTGPKELTHDDLQKLVESTPYTVAPEMTTPGISAKAQSLLTALQVVATVQDSRKAELLEMVSAARKFGEDHARRHDVPFSEIENATWYEVEDTSWKREDLQARMNPFVMFWGLEGDAIFHGEDAARIIADANRIILKTNVPVTQVKGVCASKGKATGRAVVVFEQKEFGRVQDGDILFTMMTRPEFLPVMHRAAAFVCDEGGLTSHAAIVAREMGKPCVVATKIGTRVFKEGDIVEVDANTGIVKLLERA